MTSFEKSIRIGAMALMLAFIAVGCSSISVTDVLDMASTAQNLEKGFEDISPEEEYYIGRAVAAMIAGQYAVYDNAAANAYVNTLGQTLAQASDRPQTYGGYHFQILDSEEINAFAAPGGFIFITRGMLKCAKHEGALAAVLAHEIGHVQEKHGLQSIQKSRITSALADLALKGAQYKAGEASFILSSSLAIFEGSINDIVTTMVTNGYSRAFEKEADQAAATILQRIGYDPNSLVEMLQVMQTLLKPDGKDFAKTHPSPESRMAELEKTIGAYQPVQASPVTQKRFNAALKKI